MSANASLIVEALQAVVSAVGAKRGVIGIKKKYTRVAEILEQAMAGTGLELFGLDNFYPAGDEQILVYEVTGSTIPPLGLPKDVGVVVANVGSLASVGEALAGKPVTTKVLTVTGEAARPGIINAPIGTPIAECVEKCGGVKVDDPVYVLGGPMMGSFLDTREAFEDAVVTKTTGGVIVLPRGHYLHTQATLDPVVMQRRAATACIQCRYCTDLCPRFLIGQQFETHRVMRAFSSGLDTAMGAMQAFLCCECGVCELFSCPMQLSPRRINALFKKQFGQEGVAYEGPRETSTCREPLRPFRKIPVPRLAVKIGITEYMDLHPEFDGDLIPNKVRIPLSQHIGAPAEPVVKVGDRVRAGDVLGEIPDKALGARVHASISGLVTEVGPSVSIEGGES
jgi:Na+-translocating ferredoxin:NAD+ oxidoreductase RnfC subunit